MVSLKFSGFGGGWFHMELLFSVSVCYLVWLLPGVSWYHSLCSFQATPAYESAKTYYAAAAAAPAAAAAVYTVAETPYQTCEYNLLSSWAVILKPSLSTISICWSN